MACYERSHPNDYQQKLSKFLKDSPKHRTKRSRLHINGDFFSDIKPTFKNSSARTVCAKSKRSKHKRSSSNDLIDISERITDNSSSMNHILNSQPDYLSQFDAQTFDVDGLPSAPNDIYCTNTTNGKSKLDDLQRKISLDEGWSQYDSGLKCNGDSTMTYGIVADKELTHNNMVPYFSTKHGYGSNDTQAETVMNYKNELFTGNMKSTWNKKQEVAPLFNPAANSNFIYGTPVRTDEETSRYNPGRYRQNEKLFDSVKVTPGLGLNYDEVGTHGFHNMVRVLDKTVDELRVKPKITYEGRIIEGQKGQARPIQAAVTSYRPDTFKTTTVDDMLPTDNVVDGPKSRDNFIMKETDRANQHFEYTGGAYTSNDAVGRNVPEQMRAQIKYSEKATFTLPKPLQKFSKTEAKFNSNTDSYHIAATRKDGTIDNNHIGTATAPGSTSYVGITDAPKTTLKEITAAMPQTHTMVASNTMRGTAQPMDITRPTLKETTIDAKLNPHVSNSTAQRVYYNDIAKSTVKETTCGPVIPANATQSVNLYTNLNDNARSTIKETTVDIPYQTITTAVDQNQRAPDYMDNAKSTIKEITTAIQRNTITTPVNQNQRAPNLSDQARTTIKETTTNIPYQTMATPVNQRQRAPDYMDAAKSTVKETTVTIPYQTLLTPVNQSQRAPDYNDRAKSTIKETTTAIPRNTHTIPIGQNQRAPDYCDAAKATIKETTVDIPYQTMTTPINQHQRAPDYNDIARATTKETTIITPWNTNTTAVNQQQRAPDHSDTAKPTIKETTTAIPRATMTTPINQHQRAPDFCDIARPTIKETTISIPYQSMTTPVNQHQRAPDYSDIAKTTIRETTASIPYQTVATPINQQQRAPDYYDLAKSTTKETTATIHRNTMATPVNQHQRAPDYSDIARSTIKETTATIHRNTNTTPINQHQRAPDYNDIAKSTIKETTTAIPRNTMATPVNQYQRAPDYYDIAKSTIKETTTAIPRNTTVSAVGQSQRTPNLTDLAKQTIRQTTVTIPYQTVTTGVGSHQGQASTFNKTPLKTTMKEQTVTIPYNTTTTAVGQSQRTPNYTDIAKQTVKETTVTIPYNTTTTAVGQSQRTPNLCDTAKPTTKETTVTIPYNTTTTAIGQMNGQASAYDRTPQRTTVKETTIDNNHIGVANADINGKGHGYMAEKMHAPNTNKQFTCQEVYVAPIQGQSSNKSYLSVYDTYDENKDDRKEKLHWYYEPTKCNVNMGPESTNLNVKLRTDKVKTDAPMHGYSVNNHQDRMQPHSFIKQSENIDSMRFIDPVLLQQLQSNPYSMRFIQE